jgi:endonuclease/exonuclease/phosphatase family metal-dependent hydrolase
MELQLGGIRFFLLHLALHRETRRLQLDYIKKIAAINPEPMIIAGDFNTFAGDQELDTFIRDLDLYDPNKKGLPTFPSQAPKKKLDFILCSRSVKALSFEVPQVRFSDHLPLILDFELA